MGRRSSSMDAMFSCTRHLSAISQSVPLCHLRSKRAKKAFRERATLKDQGLEENHRRAKIARGKAKERMERKVARGKAKERMERKEKIAKRTRAKKSQINLKKRQRQSLVRCRLML